MSDFQPQQLENVRKPAPFTEGQISWTMHGLVKEGDNKRPSLGDDEVVDIEERGKPIERRFSKLVVETHPGPERGPSVVRDNGSGVVFAKESNRIEGREFHIGRHDRRPDEL
jgi:hypothetical protein